MVPDPVESDSHIAEKTSPSGLPASSLGKEHAFGIWFCDGEGGALEWDSVLLGGMLGPAGPGQAFQPAAGNRNGNGAGPGGAEGPGDGLVCEAPPGEWESLSEKWRLRLRDGLPWNHEFRIMDAKMGSRHVLSRAMPVRGPSGSAVGWVGVDIDITDIRENEDELRQSQDRFRVALESGCDLLYECEMATGSRRWFGPVDDLLGYGRSGFERTQAAWESALHPEDRERVLEARQRHLENSGPFHMEYRIMRRDGECLHWLDRGKIMHDRDGSPLLWIGFVTDMTDRRRSEEMLRKSEERRRMSQRMEVIGRLAGGVAHDFNNLLTAVNGYSELVIAQLEEDSDLVPHMKEILRAGERAANLTRQLLAFSRRQVLAPKVLDLNAVILEMRKMLGEFLGPPIEIGFRPAARCPRIKADPAQVEQVLVNLALNAKDAMPQGGRLLIETGDAETLPADALPDQSEGEGRPGPFVMLSVRDSGIGMDEETKAHIFEPFYTTKGRAQGLGLAAVYGIVKQSGGHIGVASAEGEGTEIRLYWPCFEEAQAPAGRGW